MPYTKGDWKVEKLPITGGLSVYANGELIAAGLMDGDAQLIAAAPDLYEACKDAAAVLRNSTDIPKLEEDRYLLSELERKLHEAIAKAEGK